MSLDYSNNDAKKDTEDNNEPDIEDEIGGTKEENEQVTKQIEGNTNNSINMIDPSTNQYILPLNISLAQIDELFPKLGSMPYTRENTLALFNYLQTLHFAYKQLEAQYYSAQNTIQVYEDDMRQLNTMKENLTGDSTEYHTRMKKLEDQNKILLKYIDSLRIRFTNYVTQQFTYGFERMKEADELTNLLASEFTYNKDESDTINHEHN